MSYVYYAGTIAAILFLVAAARPTSYSGTQARQYRRGGELALVSGENLDAAHDGLLKRLRLSPLSLLLAPPTSYAPYVRRGQCPLPPMIRGGEVRLLGLALSGTDVVPPAVDHFDAGEVARYICSPGLRRSGPATRTCLANGAWSGATPLCMTSMLPPATLLKVVDSPTSLRAMAERLRIKSSVRALRSRLEKIRAGQSTGKCHFACYSPLYCLNLTTPYTIIVFILRIQKSGSTLLRRMFGLDFGSSSAFDKEERDITQQAGRSFPACGISADCLKWSLSQDPWLKKDSQDCDDRKCLLTEGRPCESSYFKLGQMHALREPWPIELARSPALLKPVDCIRNIYSYSYLRRYHERMTKAEKQAVELYFKSARFITGHFRFGIHEISSRESFTYVTMLRSPVSRIVSQWNWWVRKREDGLPGTQKEALENATFDQFLWDRIDGPQPGFGGYMKSNHITRVLCSMALHGIQGPYAMEQSSINDLEVLSSWHLSCAKANLLKHFSLVLVLEDIENGGPSVQEAINIYVTQVHRLYFSPKKRVSRGKSNKTPFDNPEKQVRESDLTTSQLERLKGLNSLDLELYEFGRELFRHQKKELEAMLEADRRNKETKARLARSNYF